MVADLTDLSGRKRFEKLYIGLRQKENRLYADDLVKELPHIQSSHVHSGEWAIRKRSANRLINYLRKRNRQLSILETGCGNGWLCARLGELSGADITGIDINESELNQAKRVFQNRANIQFLVGDISDALLDKKFDIIVFAASIQYFPSLSQILGKAFSILNPGGEIHILDSPFYTDSEIADAERRSYNYYQSIGYWEMIPFYFQIMFDPNRSLNKLSWRKDPFPWICIKAS